MGHPDSASVVRSDSLSATVTADGGGRYVLDGALLLGDTGRLALAGEATAQPDGWSLEGAVRGGFGPTHLLADMRVDSLGLDASALRTANGWERASGELSVVDAGWRDVVVDTLLLRGGMDATRVELDTLALDSNLADLRGGGSVETGVDSTAIRVSGQLNDVGPIIAPDDPGSVSIGRSRLEATVTGTRDSMALSAAADVRALVYGSLRASGVDLSSTARLNANDSGDRELGGAKVQLGIDRLALSETEVRRIDVTAGGAADSLRLDASALVDDSRRGTLHARIDRLTDRRRATLERLDLQLDEDEWTLVDSARVDYGDTGGYALRSFLLRSGSQEIAVDGSVGPDGALDATVDVDSVDVGTVTDLVGLPGVEGWLAGRTRLGGTTERPSGRAYLRGALHLPSAPPAPARISVRSDGSRLSADVDLHSENEGHLRVDATLRIPGTPDTDGGRERPPLDVRIVSEGFRLTALQPFVDAGSVTGLDGSLDADFSLQGTLNEPETEGTLHVRRGRMRLPALGVEYEELGAHVRGQGAKLVIDSLRMQSGPGDASLTGTAALTDPYPIDLVASLSGFQAVRTEAYRGTVSGRLTASGDVVRPVVGGDVDIESLDVFMGGRVESRDLMDVELTVEDLRMLRDRFGYVPRADDQPPTPLTDRLTGDLVVHLGRDSWLRNRSSPELSVPFTGDVEVHLRQGEPPSLEGRVTTIGGRGFIEQFGRRFELRDGTVTFDGPPRAARLDLAATYTIPSRDNPDDAEATIVLSVEGTQDSLSLNLSSDPPMENADIVSYIATGRPAAGALSFEESESEGGLTGAGADLALGRLVGVIESAAGEGVGLDVVEIRNEGLREATLVAGKYVSPRVYVGFSQPITLREGDGLSLGDEGESEIEVEVEALRWLLLNLEGSSSAVRLFLKGRHAY
jgi:translocation and assembly module TamB